MDRSLNASWIGRIAYAPAFELQRALADRRAAGEIGDTLLLLEHDAVYTLGRRATEAEVLLDNEALAARGISVERTDRGGRVTYHGPGQLVGYPIVDLGVSGDLVAYVRTLERALIATATEYGIEAGTIEGLTGVWVGDAKLAAIGVHVSRGVTTHGFALNVTADLDAFNGIIPCGIVDRGVTSIEALTGLRPGVEEVGTRAATHLARLLDRSLQWVAPASLEASHV
ncbi:MAG: lipoyl(octanoyl) transferase LipB [Actinomycetota bacterium]